MQYKKVSIRCGDVIIIGLKEIPKSVKFGFKFNLLLKFANKFRVNNTFTADQIVQYYKKTIFRIFWLQKYCKSCLIVIEYN